jgi:hypothetical protein
VDSPKWVTYYSCRFPEKWHAHQKIQIAMALAVVITPPTILQSAKEKPQSKWIGVEQYRLTFFLTLTVLH